LEEVSYISSEREKYVRRKDLENSIEDTTSIKSKQNLPKDDLENLVKSGEHS